MNKIQQKVEWSVADSGPLRNMEVCSLVVETTASWHFKEDSLQIIATDGAKILRYIYINKIFIDGETWSQTWTRRP